MDFLKYSPSHDHLINQILLLIPDCKLNWWIFILAVVAPLIAPILLLPIAPLLSYLWKVMDPVFFVESNWQ